ncbi:MAG TPA: hypothetical protein PLB96_12355 [Syntrophales bacterium]|jgi:ABC-type lipoprotein export system ATPase subunit|nr:hypothetical protein [Syntrophales bacterium]
MQDAFVREHGGRVGIVSQDIPLISNLDVLGNITLIREYHGNLPREAIEDLIRDLLRRFDLAAIAHKRSAVLSGRERFVVKLLRAAMVMDAVVVIDRPFRLLHDPKDYGFVLTSLKKIDEWYKECHIFDYQWNEERYGGADAPQDGT